MDAPQKIQITQTGLAALKQELADLQQKREKLVERLTRAREEGDLSENNDYIEAKNEIEFIDGRIAELQEVINNSQVAPNTSNSTIDIGNQVTLQIKNKTLTYHIVGEWEADPASRKISHESPLGQALIGKKVGEEVEVEAPVGKIKYKIVKID